jgi:hypothetical protein
MFYKESQKLINSSYGYFNLLIAEGGKNGTRNQQIKVFAEILPVQRAKMKIKMHFTPKQANKYYIQ